MVNLSLFRLSYARLTTTRFFIKLTKKVFDVLYISFRGKNIAKIGGSKTKKILIASILFLFISARMTFCIVQGGIGFPNAALSAILGKT